jgi:L-amino acid N-acyltransferase YncA
MTLRFATLDDAGDFIEIYAPAVTETAISFEEKLPTLEDMRDRIEKVTARYPWIVASESNRVIGYAYASAHRDRASYRWSVDVSVYVRDGVRKRGVGRLLYEHLIKILSTQRFHRAYAGITLPNPASVALHEAVGFKKIATYGAVGFKFGAWHDTGWWQLDLGHEVGAPKEPLSIHDIDVSLSV